MSEFDTEAMLHNEKIVLDKKPTDLMVVIESVVKAITPIAKKSALKFKVNYPDELIWLMLDASRMEQALLNLLYNAIKFTPRGGLIWLDVVKQKNDVVIKVKDTGVGITTPEMEYVFESYYQREQTRDKNSGLGIGLMLVRQVIKLHGGEVEVTSAGGEKGSEFVITLPILDLAQPTKANESPSSDTEANTRDDPQKILVVDDNQAAADSLARLLLALGHSAQSLYSGKTVLAFLEQNDIDVIFLDLGMPDMNGYELVKLLRDRGYGEIKIIALTGYGLPEDKEKSLRAGFDAHLTKPVGIPELRSVLGEKSKLLNNS